jgi:bifunctional enzyme CysN/CysC
MRNTDLGAADVARDAASQQDREFLRIVTCGEAGAGKSTLVERLACESRTPSGDEPGVLARRFAGSDMHGGDPDFALPLDGFTHEQGIAIDVAHRLFATDKRAFVVADPPGDEQYTRNMLTGASTADVALVVVDARRGAVTETHRHSHLASLLGIRNVVLAVNKLDLVGYSKAVFDAIDADYRAYAQRIGLSGVMCIPVSAARGDNVTSASADTPWYGGPTLLGHLATVEVQRTERTRPLRMIVQRVDRPDSSFSGRIVSGAMQPGTRVRVLPGGADGTVARIASRDADLDIAMAGRSVTIALRDGVDVSRGDVIAAAASPPGVADQFETTVIWMHEDEMLPGRPYLARIGARTAGVALAAPKYRVDADSLEHLAARTLKRDEIGVCNVSFDAAVAFDPYAENRDTGGFLVIDRLTNHTVGAALVHFALRRSQNIHWQAIDVDKAAHAALKGHRPCVVWFTGLSGAGKSTIANIVEKKLHAMGRHTYLLDGDNVRHGLNRDLGFTEPDRVENIRRVAEVARLMVDAGLIVLVSFIAPFRAERRMARGLVRPDEFCEVFVDTPLAVAEQRDRKGLYVKARRGELVNFTGIDSPYETPEHPELRLDTVSATAEQAAEAVLERLRDMGVLEPPPART